MNDHSRTLHAAETESDQIDRLVRELIAQAESKGTRKLVGEMYRECRYYPSWIKRAPREYVPHIILEASEEEAPKEKGASKKITRLRLEKGEICFSFFETFSGMGQTNYGKLEVLWNGAVVLTLRMEINWDEGDEYVGPEWYSTGIEGYISGPWEDELQNLKQAIAAQKTARESKAKDDPLRLADLKKRFGL